MMLGLLVVGPERADFYRVEVAVMEAWALAGALSAALQLQRGDYLRNGVLTIVGNLASAKATWMLAHASLIAGLEPPWSAPIRVVVQVVALGLALLVTGGATLTYTRQVAQGDTEAIRMLASYLGDILPPPFFRRWACRNRPRRPPSRRCASWRPRISAWQASTSAGS
jgi:hypothetical protein